MKRSEKPRLAPAVARTNHARFQADVDELRQRLAAVAQATSDAADIIIAGLEELIEKSGGPPDGALDALSACVFHDVVGQHVARANELLAMIEKLGAPRANGASAVSPSRLRRARKLVNGPKLHAGDGLDQKAIDDFF